MQFVDGEKMRLKIPETKHFNILDYSELKSVHTPIVFRNIDLRYVVSGKEQYQINGKSYGVKSGQFLVVNNHVEGYADIESDHLVKGIGIDINPEIIAEIVANQLEPGAPIPDLNLDTFLTSNRFVEQVLADHNTQTGRVFKQIAHSIEHRLNTYAEVDNAFYFSVGEALVQDLKPVLKQLQNIHAVKASTKHELYKKVAYGKYLLQAHFSEPTVIVAIAREVGLSEYHFFRLFKEVYGVSPYQFLLQKRIEAGCTLLANLDHSVSEIALDLGFADLFSFSKSFRKIKGISPTDYRGKKRR
jgi:AraC family transcriptional regulator